MQHEFWQEKWRSNQIGFHQQQVNALLVKHWSAMQVRSRQCVFVPLCGKTLDVLWFLQQGYKVLGVELSELALDALAQTIRDQLGLTITKSTQEHQGQLYTTYRGNDVFLVAGDFFALTPSFLQACEQSIDVIYDRAAIVALPTAMRARYAEHLVALSAAAPQLLLTFDYQQNLYQGPPFSVPAAEVHAHYQGAYQQLDLLEVRELIEQEPNFQAQGLESFKQLVYRLGH